MKKLVLVLSLTLFTAFVFAQEQQAVEKKEISKNAPVLTFDKRYIVDDEVVYDYGNIKVGSDGICYFVFTNTGKEPLLVEKTSACCGASTSVPESPVLPGQKDSISVKYNTSRAFTISKSITVFSNAANDPIVIKVKGEVVE